MMQINLSELPITKPSDSENVVSTPAMLKMGYQKRFFRVEPSPRHRYYKLAFLKRIPSYVAVRARSIEMNLFGCL